MDDHHDEPSNLMTGFAGLAIALVWLTIVAVLCYQLAIR
ncbi:MAG: hypothetical protein JWM27_4561 [Gemmatimonadetes bacterium]|nr:hypothetical protein [Gemmatimonadota bacterium]